MPLRVKGTKEKETPKQIEPTPKNSIKRNQKRNHPKKLTSSVRDRAGVTWDLSKPPSALASVVEQAIRDPKFPDDEKGQELKAKYSEAMPMGLYLYADMLQEYWEQDPIRREAISYYSLHRLRNAGIRGVGYTARPNLELVGAIAPFCHVSIDNLLLYADNLSINIDKEVSSDSQNPVKYANDNGGSIMCESVFVSLLRDTICKYGNDVRAFVIALNLGVDEPNKVIRDADVEAFLAGRQPTHTEIGELSRLVKHPATCNPDPEWLYEKSLQKCLKNS